MKSITIISHRNEGVIADVMQTLADVNINIENISGDNYGSHTLVCLNVKPEDAEKAMDTLQNVEGLQVMGEDTLMLKVKNETGALARIARRFTEAGIDIRSIRFVQRHDDHALVAVSSTRTEESRKLVSDLLVA